MFSNSEILTDLETKLNHVCPHKRTPLIELLLKYKKLFSDVSNRTDVLMHDVDFGNACLIKQHPYHVYPNKLQNIKAGSALHVGKK